jgi:hypothetical protein
VTYEDIVRALKSHYRDHQLVVAYWSQNKARTQLSSESLQKCAPANKFLTHQALVKPPNNFIQREAALAFTDEAKDWKVKGHLVMEGCSTKTSNMP